MSWRDFDRLIREEDASPERLAAAIKGNPNDPPRALRVALFMIFNLKDQTQFEHLINWVWKLVEARTPLLAHLPGGDGSEEVEASMQRLRLALAMYGDHLKSCNSSPSCECGFAEEWDWLVGHIS